MADKDRRSSRVISALLAVTILAFSLAVIGISVTKGGLAVAIALVSLAGGLVTIAGVSLSLWRYARRPPTSALVSTPAQIDQAQQVLAASVLAQWRAEIAVRQLDHPNPLAVRWKLTKLDIADQSVSMTRLSRLGRRQVRGPLRFDGRADQITQLADHFRKLTLRRLVILGDAGMGKTTLAVLLLRELLQNSKTGEPVPVLLSASDWNPQAEQLYDWLPRKLAKEYPALRSEYYGPNVLEELIIQRRILPVLDGIDELPEPMRPRILAALNAAMTSADSIVLTCRTSEYQAAVTALGGEVLDSGAVIEPAVLMADDICAYIYACLNGHLSQGWSELLAHLRSGPVLQALSNPLALWLLRKVYIDAGRDPLELCDSTVFPVPEKIKHRLFDGLISALILADKSRPSASLAGAPRHQWSWDPEAAKRWLGYLTKDRGMPGVRTPGTRDLAWWQLSEAVPLRKTKTVLGAFAGLGLGLAASPIYSPLTCVAGALIFWCGVPAEPAPRYASIQIRHRLNTLPGQMAMSFKFTVLVGIAVWLVATILVGVRAAILPGATFAIFGGLAFTLSGWIVTPVPLDRASSPRSTLRKDLMATAAHALAVGVTAALTIGLTFGFVLGLATGVMFGLMGGLGTTIEVRMPYARQVRVPFGFEETGAAAAAYSVAI